ncbi:MAG: 4Fe-4S binding protein [Chloroflexi bacterium]|nr:4Fe-4S binding protein [Chloroflexota bacterium]MCL5074726.1 4Fe-4S binding protein [Chloroflexota bacterium]
MADLSVSICSLKFPNPVMPAAGPPVRDAARCLAAIEGGAGGIVTKTISVKAADVPTPNMAEIKGGFLNTELWSELSPEEWVEKEYPAIRKACNQRGIPLIVGLGYTADDIKQLAPKIKPFADAVELSTHYLGEDPGPMVATIKAAKQALDVPVFVKLSPGVRDLIIAAKAAEEAGADGLVAINSMGPCFGIDIETGRPLMGGKEGYGWLSGQAIKALALRCVYDVCCNVNIPVIGVGGISNGPDAIEMLMVGAQAVQLCTAAILRGPTIFGRVAKEMNKWLDAHDYHSLADVQGRTLKLRTQRVATSTYNLAALKPPQLVAEKCTGCGLCVISCLYGAITLPDKVIAIDEKACWRCGVCVSRCRFGALSIGGAGHRLNRVRHPGTGILALIPAPGAEVGVDLLPP